MDSLELSVLYEKSWILILLGENASKLDHESGTEI